MDINEYLDTLEATGLVDLKKQVDLLIRKKRREKKKLLASKFRQLAEESGLAVSEISWSDEGKGGRKTRVVKESKMCFRNPKNQDQSWTGRGRRPGWYLDAIAAGVTREEMAS